MKKIIGILVLFVAISFTDLNANTTNIIEEIGVGECFNTWTIVYNGAIANGASTTLAFDLANIAFNDCVAQQQ